MSKTKNKYVVIGANTSNGKTEMWRFDTLDFAKAFAETAIEETGGEYIFLENIGVMRPKKQPVEFIAADDQA